jgi:hypothetical protein
MPSSLALWSLVVGALSAIIGYRVGIHVQSSDGIDTELVARNQLAAWNKYAGALRELAVVRINSINTAASNIQTQCILDTYKQAVNSSSALAADIGEHFGNVAAETFRLLLNEHVDNFDAIFVHVTAGEDATDAAKVLYASGQKLSEYLNSLTMLFNYNEVASMIKIFFDLVIRIPVDYRRFSLTYETTNLDALFDHTAAVSSYFASTLSKYDRLKRYIARV